MRAGLPMLTDLGACPLVELAWREDSGQLARGQWTTLAGLPVSTDFGACPLVELAWREDSGELVAELLMSTDCGACPLIELAWRDDSGELPAELPTSTDCGACPSVELACYIPSFRDDILHGGLSAERTGFEVYIKRCRWRTGHRVVQLA